MIIKSERELRELYGFPKGRAALKTMSSLDSYSIDFIAKCSFMLISTAGLDGSVDCSPRGGDPGFIAIEDADKLIIPDFKGNNRLDSLVNVIESQKVGCLLLIPGIEIVLRINGTCALSNDEYYVQKVANEVEVPKCVIVMEIEELFFHCSKAIHRSSLWADTSRVNKDTFPSIGKMIDYQLTENDMKAPIIRCN